MDPKPIVEPGGAGYSHILPIEVCAAQQGRDFEAPDLNGVYISEAFSRTGYKKLSITALSFCLKLLPIMKKHLFDA